MDVTDKESVIAGQEVIRQGEGKLHILVNKLVPYHSIEDCAHFGLYSAGISGPLTPWLNDPSAPQHKDIETLGRALFDSATYNDWGGLFGINTSSMHFVTTAFLGLLAEGSKDEALYTSSVINVTSLSGNNKLAQNQVGGSRSQCCTWCVDGARQFAYNASKAAATHLTKMFATEFALKKIPVRVNAVAPGVYESEMTYPHIPPEEVDKIGKSIVPIPAHRAGRYATLPRVNCTR